MTFCIRGCAQKNLMLVAVNQCLKYSLTKCRKELFRELRTYATPRIFIQKEFNYDFLTWQSRVKFYRTNLRATVNNGVLNTGYTNLSSYQNKSKISGEEKKEKVSIVQKFKQMYKEYWYVLIPVHIVTSTVWFGGFYYAAESGINLVEILDSLGAPNSWVEAVRNSKAGGFVAAYTLYKIATPLRYTVTIGGTTIAINYLKKWGWIRPVPNKEKFKRIYEEQKGAFKDFTLSYQDKVMSKKDDILKAKKEIIQQYDEVTDDIHRSLSDQRKMIKSNFSNIFGEFRHIGRLFVRTVKKKIENKPDYIAKPVDTTQNKKNKK